MKPWCPDCWTWHAEGKHVPPLPPEALDPALVTHAHLVDLAGIKSGTVLAAARRLGVGVRCEIEGSIGPKMYVLFTKDEAHTVLREIANPAKLTRRVKSSRHPLEHQQGQALSVR